ncbi:MAG: sensor histidine kinase [Bacteroidetes bacterium]|nr:sensor histidine kinase [Bacteroidota bacterium]
MCLHLPSVGQTTAQLMDSANAYVNKDFKKAIAFANTAYHTANSAKSKRDIAATAFLLGYTNYMAGNHDEALKYYVAAEQQFADLHDTAGLQKVYKEKAVFYTKQKKFAEANAAVSTALVYAEKLKDTSAIADDYNTRGVMFLDEKRDDSAIHYFRKAYNYYRLIDQSVGMSYSLDYLASALSEIDSLDEALGYLQLSRQLRIKTGDRMGEALAVNNIGELLLAQKKPKEAISWFKDAAEKSHALSFTDLEANTYKMMATAYGAIGDYKMAFNSSAEYEKLHEQILNEKRINAIEELQTRYETEKKEHANKLLTEANKLQALKLNRNRIAIAALSIVALLGILIFWLIYNRSRIQQQNQMREEILRQQQLRAKAVMDAEEMERQRIARELHDGVGQLLAATRRNIVQLQPPPPADSDPLSLIDESIREVRQLSHQMMPPSLRNKSLRSAIEELAARLSQGGALKVATEFIEADSLQTSPEVTLMLYRILQEISANTIKHAGATTINIELVNHDTELTLMVYDDGKGFDKQEVMAAGGGLGLKNIEARVAYINGSLEIDSRPGKGTTYIIEVPLGTGKAA